MNIRSTFISLLLALATAPMSAGDAVVVMPKPLEMKQPVYPLALRKEGISGTVIVEIIIGIDGKVESARVIKAPDDRMNASVEKAARLWRFTPATSNGKPTRMLQQYPIEFNLKK